MRQLRKKTKKQRRALFGKIRRAKGLTIKIRPGKRGTGHTRKTEAKVPDRR